MTVDEAKSRYLAARAAVQACQQAIQSLQIKADQLQEALPGLGRAIEAAEKAKEGALAAFALEGNKQTESTLRATRTECDSAERRRGEALELSEAVGRALAQKQAEFVRLNNSCDVARRGLWQVIADEIQSTIPASTFEAIWRLEVIGSQCGRVRQGILDSLFPRPSSGEHQAIFAQLSKEHGIE